MERRIQWVKVYVNSHKKRNFSKLPARFEIQLPLGVSTSFLSLQVIFKDSHILNPLVTGSVSYPSKSYSGCGVKEVVLVRTWSFGKFLTSGYLSETVYY